MNLIQAETIMATYRNLEGIRKDACDTDDLVGLLATMIYWAKDAGLDFDECVLDATDLHKADTRSKQ